MDVCTTFVGGIIGGYFEGTCPHKMLSCSVFTIQVCPLAFTNFHTFIYVCMYVASHVPL